MGHYGFTDNLRDLRDDSVAQASELIFSQSGGKPIIIREKRGDARSRLLKPSNSATLCIQWSCRPFARRFCAAPGPMT